MKNLALGAGLAVLVLAVGGYLAALWAAFHWPLDRGR